MDTKQHKSFPLYIWGLWTVLAVFATSCTTLDLDNMDKDISISPSIVLPLGEAQSTLLDIAKKIDSENFGYDEAGNYAYLHYFDSIKFNSDSALRRHIFTEINSYDFEFSELATPEIINSYPLNLPIGLPAIFEHQYKYNLGYDKIENGVIVQRMDSMHILSANIKMTISIQGITGISASNPMKLELQIPDISIWKNRTFTYNITSNSFVVDEAITNAIIRLYQDNNEANIRLNLKYTLSGPITISENYKISHHIEMQNVDYHKAWGFFNRTEVLTGDNITTTLPEEFIQDQGLWDSRLLFHNPTFTIDVRSNVGIPLLINVDYIKASDKNGQSVYADFRGSRSYSMPVPQALEDIATATTTLDRDNGKTNLLFTINPKTIDYKLGLKIDNQTVNQGGIYAKHFAQLPIYTNMLVDLKIPFTFDPTSEYVYNDSIKLDDKLEVVINKPKEIDLNLLHINLDCENNLPIQAIANIICLDTIGNELYRKEGFKINAPKVDANGFSIEAWKGVLTLNFEKGDIQNILRTKSIAIEVVAKGYDESSMINARLTDYLKFKASLYANGTYTTHTEKK